MILWRPVSFESHFVSRDIKILAVSLCRTCFRIKKNLRGDCEEESWEWIPISIHGVFACEIRISGFSSPSSFARREIESIILLTETETERERGFSICFLFSSPFILRLYFVCLLPRVRTICLIFRSFPQLMVSKCGWRVCHSERPSAWTDFGLIFTQTSSWSSSSSYTPLYLFFCFPLFRIQAYITWTGTRQRVNPPSYEIINGNNDGGKYFMVLMVKEEEEKSLRQTWNEREGRLCLLILAEMHKETWFSLRLQYSSSRYSFRVRFTALEKVKSKKRTLKSRLLDRDWDEERRQKDHAWLRSIGIEPLKECSGWTRSKSRYEYKRVSENSLSVWLNIYTDRKRVTNACLEWLQALKWEKTRVRSTTETKKERQQEKVKGKVLHGYLCDTKGVVLVPLGLEQPPAFSVLYFTFLFPSFLPS